MPFIKIQVCRAIIVAVMALSLSAAAHANSQPFESWLQDLRADARAEGISDQTIQEALSNIQPIARVIELDRKQPEGRMSFAQYKKKVINQQRIDTGRELYQAYGNELRSISAEYGVPPQYIVALWGLETSYGNNTGGFKVIPALATLAYDGRRASFFRKELINALKIIDGGHISAQNMKGSWAGAMGQNQFMPSSFHAYAVDGNGDGRRDIWNTIPDVFASTANYLSTSGWRGDEKWGRAVTLPSGFPKNLTGLETKKSLQEWASMGVTAGNGQSLQGPNLEASIVTPDGLSGPAYIVYGNYRVIMKWNKSTYFATTVGLLADAIAR
jgi:membrane-bound lytic murein transglycosylase B